MYNSDYIITGSYARIVRHMDIRNTPRNITVIYYSKQPHLQG